MALSLNNLKPARGAKKARIRIGRGNSSGRGTYSGRGLKGQRSRTGASGLKYIGMKAQIMKLPKFHGFTSLKPRLATVNLADLEKNFSDGDIINFYSLRQKGLIKKSDFGVKILGDGQLMKKLIIKANQISQSAKAAVEKAGGTVSLQKLSTDRKKTKPQKADSGKNK